MFDIRLGLGVSHFAVSRAIIELEKERQIFGCEDIALYIGSSERTVRRCLAQMIDAQIVERIGSRRCGYRYRCLQPNYNWSDFK